MSVSPAHDKPARISKIPERAVPAHSLQALAESVLCLKQRTLTACPLWISLLNYTLSSVLMTATFPRAHDI